MKRLILILAALLVTISRGECCTTVIVSAEASGTGRPLMWKQRDTSVGFNYLEWFPGSEGHYGFLGIVNTSDKKRESVWCGANEAGLSIINSVSYGLSPIRTDDRPYEGMVMKKALETCATVDEFEALIKSLDQPNGLETNFGVIDAYGGAAYFETHDLGYVRFDVSGSKNGYLIRTNYSMTGREGEGKGYDRYDIAASRMASCTEGFTPEWIIDNLGRETTIARDKTVSSVVFEGVGPGESPVSTMLWCISGYTPYCYAMPVWVAAGDLIPEPLKKTTGRGSVQNEWSIERLRSIGDIEPGPDGKPDLSMDQEAMLDAVRNAEVKEISQGRLMDAAFRKNGIDRDAVKAYNKAAQARFKRFISNR